MIYGKLPIVLLSTLATQADGTTDCNIAHFILENPQRASRMTIVELARSCHASVSSVSRFCREIGLCDFAELRELIRHADWRFDAGVQSAQAQERLHSTLHVLHESLEALENSVDMEQIGVLCRKIDAYERVAVFGLLKAGTAAQCLQADLLLLGKVAVCKLPFAKQIEYMEQAAERDLILIFSYSGIYFDYLHRRIPRGLRRAHVVFITGKRDSGMRLCGSGDFLCLGSEPGAAPLSDAGHREPDRPGVCLAAGAEGPILRDFGRKMPEKRERSA